MENKGAHILDGIHECYPGNQKKFHLHTQMAPILIQLRYPALALSSHRVTIGNCCAYIAIRLEILSKSDSAIALTLNMCVVFAGKSEKYILSTGGYDHTFLEESSLTKSLLN